jgi:cellobiose-specific phosphotransferase system component IIC
MKRKKILTPPQEADDVSWAIIHRRPVMVVMWPTGCGSRTSRLVVIIISRRKRKKSKKKITKDSFPVLRHGICSLLLHSALVMAMAIMVPFVNAPHVVGGGDVAFRTSIGY